MQGGWRMDWWEGKTRMRGQWCFAGGTRENAVPPLFSLGKRRSPWQKPSVGECRSPGQAAVSLSPNGVARGGQGGRPPPPPPTSPPLTGPLSVVCRKIGWSKTANWSRTTYALMLLYFTNNNFLLSVFIRNWIMIVVKSQGKRMRSVD